MRQDTGEELVETQFPGHPRGDVAVVPGHHHAPDAHLLEPADRLPRLRPDDIGERERSREPVVLEQEDDGLALLLERLDPSVPGIDAPFREVTRTDHPDVPAADRSLDADPRDRPEPFYRKRSESPFLRTPDDAPGDRVPGVRLNRCRRPDHVLLRRAAEGEDVRDPEPPLRQGPGLVEDDRSEVFCPLERAPVPDQEPRLGGKRRRDRDHERDGEAERVGAGDDHHGRGPLHCKSGSLPEGEPYRERHRTDREGDRHQEERRPVGEILRPRPALLRLSHEVDHLREVGLRTRPPDLDDDRALTVDRPADDHSTRAFLHRARLPGEHRLVDARRPLDHCAVHRHLLSGPDEDPVARFEPVDGHVVGPPVPEKVRLRGHDPDEFLERPRSPENRAHLHPVPEEHDVDQGGEFPEESFSADETENDRRTVYVGDGDRDGDERHHPGHPRPEFAYDAGKKRPPAVEVDCGRKSEEQVVRTREPDDYPEKFLDRLREEENRNRQYRRDNEPPPEVFEGMVMRAVAGPALLRRLLPGGFCQMRLVLSSVLTVIVGHLMPSPSASLLRSRRACPGRVRTRSWG